MASAYRLDSIRRGEKRREEEKRGFLTDWYELSEAAAYRSHDHRGNVWLTFDHLLQSGGRRKHFTSRLISRLIDEMMGDQDIWQRCVKTICQMHINRNLHRWKDDRLVNRIDADGQLFTRLFRSNSWKEEKFFNWLSKDKRKLNFEIVEWKWETIKDRRTTNPHQFEKSPLIFYSVDYLSPSFSFVFWLSIWQLFLCQ